MSARLRSLFIAPAVLIVLIANAVFPFAALAEEATPPPPAATEEAPPDQATPETVETSASTDEPAAKAEGSGEGTIPTEAAALPEGTDLVVLDEAGNEVPLGSVEAAEILAGGDPLWCPTGHSPGDAECVGDIGEFTTFNGSDGLLSALEAYSADCSSATPSESCEPDGTIYVAFDYDSSGEGGAINIEHINMPFLDALTIQGGWDFSGNVFSGTPSTFHEMLDIDWLGDITLNDLVFSEIDTHGGIVVQVKTKGDISLDNVEVRDNKGIGAWLDNCPDDGHDWECLDPGHVTVTNSVFVLNDDDDPGSHWASGIEIRSGGNVTLNSVLAGDNDGVGALIVQRPRAWGEGPVTVDIGGDSAFYQNSAGGLEVHAVGIIYVDWIDVSENGAVGALLDNCLAHWATGECMGLGPIFVTDSWFNSNYGDGLHAFSAHAIDLEGVEASNNGFVDLDGDEEVDPGELNPAALGAWLHNSDSPDDWYITIEDGEFDGNSADGLWVDSSGYVELRDVSADGNGRGGRLYYGTGVSIRNFMGDAAEYVFITGSSFSDNYYRGLAVWSRGTIWIAGVDALYNGDPGVDQFGANGAYLNNCMQNPEGYCTGTSQVWLAGGMFVGNYWNGLEVNSAGDIEIYSTHAEDNGHPGSPFGGEGLYVQNAFAMESTGQPSTGSVTIAAGDYSGNFQTGIEVGSNGDVSLSTLLVQGNGQGDQYGPGVHVETSGEITLSEVALLDNLDMGAFLMNAAGDAGVTLQDVFVKGNGLLHPGSLIPLDGVLIVTNGPVLVDPSTFSSNGLSGLGVLSFSGDDIVVDCNTFEGNGLYGVHANTPGSLTLTGNVFTNNLAGDYNVIGGGYANVSSSCGSAGDGDERTPQEPPGGGLPGNVIQVAEGQDVSLECGPYGEIWLMLENGDHVMLPCPIEGQASLLHVQGDILPGDLGDGMTYLSGLNLGMNGEQGMQELDATARICFTIPEGAQAAGLRVLHWDSGEWQDLGGAVSHDGYFEAPHAQTGIYLLVSG